MLEISTDQIRKLRAEHSFFKPILKMLQDNGGELESISQIDKLICDYTDFTEDEINYFKITDKGNKYVPYHFGRNFALKNLQIAGYLTYSRNSSVRLTAEGLALDVDNLDFDRDIYSRSMPYWDQKHLENRQRHKSDGRTNGAIGTSEDIQDIPFSDDQAWRSDLLEKIKALDPYKFESFCRGLLNKMGFEVDPIKGVRKSGDDGIDGFVYCVDSQSLKTSRVAIQCKRFTSGAVGNQDMRDLRGAIDEHGAEYGIFITTSYFSRSAIESSRAGTKSITLIDGQKLVDLMVQYKYKVREVSLFIPDDEYFDA